MTDHDTAPLPSAAAGVSTRRFASVSEPVGEEVADRTAFLLGTLLCRPIEIRRGAEAHAWGGAAPCERGTADTKTGEGSLFGLVVDGKSIYYVDDGENSLKLLY